MALNINSTSGLYANRSLNRANKLANSAMEKLSSGLKINKAKDNPSGLLISELLRSQLSGMTRALSNTQEANNVMSIAEGGLSSVSSMLTKMRGLAIHSLNSGITSGAQVNADQAELNSLLSSINHVVNSTSFGGNQLLNGSREITYDTQDANSIITGSSISSVSGSYSGDVNVNYGGAGNAAQAASVAADLSTALDANGALAADTALKVNGTTINLTAGMSIEDMAAQINDSGLSGATAYVEYDASGAATGMRIDSDTAGTSAAVSVQNGGGIFAAGTAVGTDATRGTSAQAEKAYLEADFGSSTLSQSQKFNVVGTDGSRTYEFAAGTSIEEMAKQINSSADSTGVNAYAVRDEGTGATTLRLVSQDYGSDASVKVQQINGNGFAQAGRTVTDYGQDATLSVNGESVTTDGLTAKFGAGGVNGSVTLDAEAIGQTGYDQDYVTNATASQSASLTNVNNGMQLQLGEGSGGQNRDTVSIGNYNPAQLGQVTVDGETYSLYDLYGGGSASLARNPELALMVIDQAIADVAAGRANIGAYQSNTLDTNANNLMTSIQNITATESGIRDADMAQMMIDLVTAEVLQKASTTMLQKSNTNRQTVLTLLGGPKG